MPTLDVSGVLTDADISSTFAVVRRVESVGANGLATVSSRSVPGVRGVICVASPADLERLEEEDRTGRNISVVTRFRLRGTAEGGAKPDLVLWLGSRYQVKNVEPYPQYGRGFVQAIAGSVEAQDAQDLPPPPATGRLFFNEARRSSLAALIAR